VYISVPATTVDGIDGAAETAADVSNTVEDELLQSTTSSASVEVMELVEEVVEEEEDEDIKDAWDVSSDEEKAEKKGSLS